MNARMAYGPVDDFTSRAGGWPPVIGDSLLRADRTASSCTKTQRPETLRFDSPIPLGHHPTCASARLYIGGNPALVFWFPRYYSCVGTLAHALAPKAAGIGSTHGGNQDCPRATQKADVELPVRHLRSMREGHISSDESRCIKATSSQCSRSGEIAIAS